MKLGILDSGRSAAFGRSDLVGFLSRPRWALVPSPADRQTGGSRAYNSSGGHSPEDQFVEEATPSGAGRVDLSYGDSLPGAVSGICRGFSHDIALFRQSSHEWKPAVYGDGYGRKRHVCKLDDPGGGGGGGQSPAQDCIWLREPWASITSSQQATRIQRRALLQP